MGRFWEDSGTFKDFQRLVLRGKGGAGFNFCQEKMSYDNVVSIIYFVKDWKLIWGN